MKILTPRSSRQIVFDAGAGHVAGAVFSADAEGRLVLEDFARETHSADPALGSEWMGRTAEALSSLTQGRKLRGAAALAVPGHLALTKFVRTPAVAPTKRSQVIQFEAAQAIPYPLDAVAWDHLVVAGDEREIELMLTAVKLDAMESLCAAADSAGCPVKRAAGSCFALYRAFEFNYPEVKIPILVADIGARSTNLVLAGPGGRCFARTFAFAGNAVTAAVAEELHLDFARAEILKLQVLAEAPGLAENSAALAAVRRATEEFTMRLELEIMRTVGNFNLRTGAEKPAVIYLTGGGSRLPGLGKTLAGKFQVPVECYDPWRNVALSERARAAGAEASRHLLPNLVGLAAWGDAHSGNAAGLLPSAIRSARAFRKRQPYLVGAMALLVLALLPPLRHYQGLAAADSARERELVAQTEPLRVAAERNAKHLAEISTIQRKISALRRVADAKSSWLNFLADLQDRLGQIQDVWLDQLAVVAPPVSGAAAGVGSSGASAPALQLRLSGRLLAARSPGTNTTPDADVRVKQLLAAFARSPFVAAIESERFDNAQPGLLRFAFTLGVNPAHPL